jgi:hypothetical protein
LCPQKHSPDLLYHGAPLIECKRALHDLLAKPLPKFVYAERDPF